MIQLLLVMIFSHLVCDFVIQSKNEVQSRLSSNITKSLETNFIHTLKHFCFLFMFLMICKYIKYIYISLEDIIYSSISIAILHFIIDVCKSMVTIRKLVKKDNLFLFFIDQVLHIISILLICKSFKNLHATKISFGFYDKVMIMLIVLVIATSVASVFLRIFIEHFFPVNYAAGDLSVFKESIGVKDGGHIIGILERIFIIIVITLGRPEMIGFVLTAKSIARFKKLDNKNFAELFIIGTFVSFIVAIVCGVVIFKLNIFPTIC